MQNAQGATHRMIPAISAAGCKIHARWRRFNQISTGRCKWGLRNSGNLLVSNRSLYVYLFIIPEQAILKPVIKPALRHFDQTRMPVVTYESLTRNKAQQNGELTTPTWLMEWTMEWNGMEWNGMNGMEWKNSTEKTRTLS